MSKARSLQIDFSTSLRLKMGEYLDKENDISNDIF